MRCFGLPGRHRTSSPLLSDASYRGVCSDCAHKGLTLTRPGHLYIVFSVYCSRLYFGSAKHTWDWTFACIYPSLYGACYKNFWESGGEKAGETALFYTINVPHAMPSTLCIAWVVTAGVLVMKWRWEIQLVRYKRFLIDYFFWFFFPPLFFFSFFPTWVVLALASLACFLALTNNLRQDEEGLVDDTTRMR